jgi:adenylyltransferase/sulfurtransferase
MWKRAFTGSPTSIELLGNKIPGAQDRQSKIAGFDLEKYSRSHVLCIGAGGLISNIAPALVRKGIGAITILDPDVVDVSNLNRQRFYRGDIGKNKAIELTRNLKRECINDTKLVGHPVSVETAIARKIDMHCDIAVCGVDNNPARVAAAQLFRAVSTPTIFTGVSAEANHGYVFIQKATGPCIGCLFPDIANDEYFPCPGTPAISDILQLVGALAVYAVDAVLLNRQCDWNYRSEYLHPGQSSGSGAIMVRSGCSLVSSH